jgi:hypothetical protein
MTGILIVVGMNVILWKILVKLMFAKTLAGQKFLPCPALCPALTALQGKQGKTKKINSPCRAGQLCPVTVSGHYDNQEKKITGFSTILEDLISLVSISFQRALTSLA